MIEEYLFSAFPFPCALIRISGLDSKWLGESLFEAPQGTKSESQLEFYRNTNTGWSKCVLGFGVYSQDLPKPSQWRVVVYGLKVAGVSDAQGKGKKLSVRVEREHVEKLVKKTLIANSESTKLLRTIVSSGVHEVRNINKDLRVAAEELRVNLESTENVSTSDVNIIKNIEQLSAVLKVRSDAFDVISVPEVLTAAKAPYHVYRGFDRIRRSLTPSANQKSVFVELTGKSDSRIYTTQLFDVVPYILIQNCIKYSPEKGRVKINIIEDNYRIYVNISCIGPCLEKGETEKVFDVGFRGSQAIKLGKQGSGMGLFLVKRIIDSENDFSVQLFQEGECDRIYSVRFCPTYYNLKFVKPS